MFEARAHTYSNNGHRKSSGECCEIVDQTDSCAPSWCPNCDCDNRFKFCLRRYGTAHDDNTGNCALGIYSTGMVGDDSFSFNSSHIASGVTNPMRFTGSQWPVSAMFVLCA